MRNYDNSRRLRSKKFKRSVDHTLQWEGGYVDDPNDPGGATNHGISLRFLLSQGLIEEYDFNHDGDLTPVDIARLSKKQAEDLYHEYFWNNRYEDLPLEVCVKLFDLGVNMGPKQAITLLQRASDAPVIDGIFGPQTFAHACQVGVYERFVARAAKYYFNIADKRPASRKFLYGWLRRCYDELHETPL